MSEQIITPPYTAETLLRMAAEDWEKEAGRLMDDAQKQHDVMGNVLRLMAKSKLDKAKAAREIVGY